MKATVSLKSYLSAHFAAVAILPVMTIGALVWFFMMPSIEQRTKIQHQALARAIAGQVAIYLEGGKRQLNGLAAYLQNHQSRPDQELGELLDAHCGDGEFFETLFIVDNANTIQAVGLPQSRRSNRTDLMGLDLSGQRFVATMKEGNPMIWSQTFLSATAWRWHWRFPWITTLSSGK